MKTTTVIIPAAGVGKRMETKLNKQFLEINGRLVIERTIDVFEENEKVHDILVIAKDTDMEKVESIIAKNNYKKIRAVVKGGKERQDSINNSLEYIDENCNKVLIHDGARPFVEKDTIDEVIDSLDENNAVAVGVPIKDSLKLIGDSFVNGTVERKNIYGIQTPQGFKKEIVLKAYAKAYREKYYGTDDTELVERIGIRTKIVMGSYNNIKITTPEDLVFGEAILNKIEKEKLMRIGNGYDVHRLVEERKLILGGVDIPFEKGLLGHSDADVLIHAIMDSLLGAAALGDIGKQFPDTDQRYKGISSISLLEHVKNLMNQEGYEIINIDATVMAQRPKIAPYINEMRKNIGSALDVDISRISVKATTTEKLGFEGREEGISALANAMIKG